jgi:MoaA/NifB/PqqE/SkfB family radical SAM enzyme
MEEHIKRLISWSKGAPNGPYSAELHPTNLCNLDCIMCGTKLEHKRLMLNNPTYDPSDYVPYELKKEKIIEIVQEGQAMSTKKWLLTGGGEPFARKQDTLYIMKEIKRYGMFGNINTNGVLLNQNDIEEIVKMKWDIIMFSVDSHIPEVHDFMRGKRGTFHTLKKVMETFRALKKAKKSDTPKIAFNTVLCNRNFSGIDGFIKFAHSVGCADITFIPLVQFSKELKKFELNHAEEELFQKEIPYLEKTAIAHKMNTNLQTLATGNRCELHDSEFHKIHCFEPFLNIVIRMDGKYSPCCMIENYSDSLAKKSLHDVWFGSYFSNLRKSILRGNIPDGCSRCVHMQKVQNSAIREELRGIL